MSKESIRYIRYQLNSNRRILILMTAALFLLMPVTIGFTLDFSKGVQQSFFHQLMKQSMICGFLLAFFVPIYQMRFLYKKQMNDLYFSLPISKKQLFDLQFGSGLLGFMVPLIVNFLLGYIVACINNPNSTLKLEFLLMFALLLICLCVEYSIVCYFSVQCNHLLDSLFINGIYVVLPLIFVLILSSFFMNQSQLLLHDNSYDTFAFVDVIANLCSVPLYYSNLFGTSFQHVNQIIEFVIEKQYLLMLCYWIVMGVIIYGLAKRSFVKRKEESSEQQTTEWMTYPFVISFGTLLMMLLLVNENHLNGLVSIIAVVAIYCGVLFFAKRKIHLSIKNIIVFVCLFAISYGLGFVFQISNGFGLVFEVPDLQDIESASIYYQNIHLYPAASSDMGQHVDLYACGETKKELETVIAFQEDIMKKTVSEFKKEMSLIRITYRSKDGSSHIREYSLEGSEEMQEKIQAFMKENLQM